MQSAGENQMTPNQIWTNFFANCVWSLVQDLCQTLCNTFKFHWILSKSGRLILHWFTMNVFMVLCSTLMEHNLTTKCAHKKYTYVFNSEKYTHINPGIYFPIWNFLLPVIVVQINVPSCLSLIVCYSCIVQWFIKFYVTSSLPIVDFLALSQPGFKLRL